MKWIAIVLVLGALTACNTVSGFGKDIEKVGGKIDKAAK